MGGGGTEITGAALGSVCHSDSVKPVKLKHGLPPTTSASTATFAHASQNGSPWEFWGERLGLCGPRGRLPQALCPSTRLASRGASGRAHLPSWSEALARCHSRRLPGPSCFLEMVPLESFP